MSLQGTFDTLSVTELFGLLSTAEKTGALRLEAGEHEASLLVRSGRCCAVDDGAGGSVQSDAGEAQLAARLVDVGFTLARQSQGSFRFSDGEVADAAASVAFEPAVAEITEMLGAWKDIETTIPSLDVRLLFAAALPGDEIVIGAGEWALLAQLAGRPTVRELVAAAGEPLLDVCRRVKELVDRGAIEIGAAAVAAPAPPGAQAPAVVVEPEAPVAVVELTAEPPAEVEGDGEGEDLPPVDGRRSDRRHGSRDRSALQDATARLLDPIEPYAPDADGADGADGVEDLGDRRPVAVAADRDGGGDEPSADRGALLRLFSALKE